MLPGPGLNLLGATLLSLASVSPETDALPQRFGLYYSGPACPEARVDRTFSQFQVNLGSDAELLEGRLGTAPDGRALLEGRPGRGVELLSNASRADWLLEYPLLGAGTGVWGRPIFGPGCAVEDGAFYVEAIFPVLLLQGGIDPRLDLMERPDYGELKRAARCPLPWRVRLMGPADPLPDASTIDVLLSGADGSTGVFGHISVGHANVVYNIYPKGSDRGAPDLVPLWDYLFNAERGHALRRPTWLLRIQGVSAEMAGPA